MAFIRWRGNSAELLTTVYERGRGRQVRLACLGGAYHARPEVRASVLERFPRVRVDWEAVDLALAQGPRSSGSTAEAAPNDRLEWLGLERRLRYWAALTNPVRPREAERLLAAADILGQWREAKPYFSQAEPSPGWDQNLPPADPGETLQLNPLTP